MKSPVILRIFKGTQLVEVKQFEKDQIIFGNGGEVDVALADPAVSPIHCLIELRDSGYYIADLGSSSGTMKKGAQILDEPLSSGDQLGIGPFTIHFFVGVPKPKEAPPTVVKVAEPPKAAETPKTVEAPKAPVAKPTPAVSSVKPPEPAKPSIVQSPKSSTKPEIPKTMGRTPRLSKATFAPASDIVDLRKYLRPTKGPVLEVLVAWKERIISTQHFTSKKSITIGPHGAADIDIPSAFLSGKTIFADLSQGTKIFLTTGMTCEIVQAEKRYDQDMMSSLGKATRDRGGTVVRLDQGELLAIKIGDGTLQIFVRHVAATATPALAGFDLTAGELTGVVVSFVIVALLALYVSVYSPSDQPPDKQEDQLRLAQFVYTEKPKPPPEPEPVAPTPVPVKPPPPKKVEVVKQPKEAKGPDNKKSAAMHDKPARAEEVRANNVKTPVKKFTSAVKQGGSVKTTDKPAANAQSKNVNDMGLLSAFATGGNRKQLDKATSGSGDLLGDASKAQGTSGLNKNRAGDDLGGRFKDTGAGGKGTATQGIAGIKTSGRSSGQNSYGNIGSGGKTATSIEVGGAGAEFVGTVDREQVRRVVRSIYAQIKNCFDRGLVKDSTLEGKIVIHWQVVEQGHVTVSVPKEAPRELMSVARCVAERIKEQRFPEPPGGSYYEVDFPFLMSKQN